MYLYENQKETQRVTEIIHRCKLTSRQAASFVASMQHYEKHHGSVALVQYFEFLGSAVLTGEIYHIRTKKNNIVRLLKKALNSGLVYALRILELPGRWKAKSVTSKDFAKFKNRITQLPNVRSLPKTFGLTDVDEEILHDAVSTARVSLAPLTSNTTHVLEKSKENGPQDIADELYAMTMAGEVFVQFAHEIAAIFGITDDGIEELIENAQCYMSGGEKQQLSKVGDIAFLNKDGYLKLRPIANLVKGWQCAISPCTFVYKNYLKVQPESALYDQRAAAKWAADQLNCVGANGKLKKISSIDLSKATDNLPRYVFYALMDNFVLQNASRSQEHALFLISYLIDRSICDYGRYQMPNGEFVQYNKGQAMGRWTSKYQLDLTMIMLARSVGGNENNFRVNGDDIVFSDTRVAKSFSKLLDKLSVPKSANKTYMAKKFGEFSGRIFTRKLGILPLFKGRATNFKHDPFGNLRQYGRDGLHLVPKKYRKKLDIVAGILQEEDLSDFNASANFDSGGFEMKPTKTLIQKVEWSELWARQKFSAHIERAERARLTLEAMEFFQDPYQGIAVFADKYEKLRRNTCFKDVAVQRFAEPNYRLNLLVDFLLSSKVKTSDGHWIDGYGSSELDSIVERLRTEVTLAGSSKDKEAKRKGSTYLSFVDRIYRDYQRFRAWSKQSNTASNG